MECCRDREGMYIEDMCKLSNHIIKKQLIFTNLSFIKLNGQTPNHSTYHYLSLD